MTPPNDSYNATTTSIQVDLFFQRQLITVSLPDCFILYLLVRARVGAAFASALAALTYNLPQ